VVVTTPFSVADMDSFAAQFANDDVSCTCAICRFWTFITPGGKDGMGFGSDGALLFFWRVPVMHVVYEVSP
jgi:hypothetical protein